MRAKKKCWRKRRERERGIYSREKNVPVSTSPLLLSSQQPLRNWTEERKKETSFPPPPPPSFPLWLIRGGREPIVLVKKRGNVFASARNGGIHMPLNNEHTENTIDITWCRNRICPVPKNGGGAKRQTPVSRINEYIYLGVCRRRSRGWRQTRKTIGLIGRTVLFINSGARRRRILGERFQGRRREDEN